VTDQRPHDMPPTAHRNAPHNVPSWGLGLLITLRVTSSVRPVSHLWAYRQCVPPAKDPCRPQRPSGAMDDGEAWPSTGTIAQQVGLSWDPGEPKAFKPGLPDPGQLRCLLHPPIVDSHRGWVNSWGPVTAMNGGLAGIAPL
jgi:hypothetical protein